MRVGAGAGGDAVLGREARGLLVERADRDARVEDLDRVDLARGSAAGARSRAPSACGRTGAARRRRRPGGGSRRPSRRGSARAGSSRRRNRPITSPWPPVLTSSPTITLTPDAAALRARLERAGDLVVVGHRDRAEPLLARRREQHLDRRRAVGGVVGVHVQVDVDQRALRERAAQLPGRPRRRGGARRARGRSPRARRPRRRRRARAGSRRGSGAPSAPPSPAGSRCAHRGGRRSSRRSAGRAGSRAAARSRRGNEPTLSAREWRSAAFAVLGANGSCTCTKSSGDRAEQLLDGARDVDRQRRGPPPRGGQRRRAPRRPRSPAGVPRSVPCSSARRGSAARARSARRDSRTRSCEREGARTSTRCPRRESSAATRATWALTSFSRPPTDTGSRGRSRTTSSSAASLCARAARRATRLAAARAGFRCAGLRRARALCGPCGRVAGASRTWR